MEISITHWGNSLGLRIPKALAKSIGIETGSKVRLELKGGRLILSPLSDSSFAVMGKKIRLSSLVKKVHPKNLHSKSEIEDIPIGQEVW